MVSSSGGCFANFFFSWLIHVVEVKFLLAKLTLLWMELDGGDSS